jgi:hypothetical protein
MIPGSNILAMALTAIAPSTVQYYKWLSRETNAIGLLVDDYDEPYCISGSLQPVPTSMYQTLNLDFNKKYFMLYTTTDIEDLARDTSSDQIGFNGKRYQVTSRSEWNTIDGWNGIMMVQI